MGNQAQQNVETYQKIKSRVNTNRIVDFRVAYADANAIGGHDMTWTWEHLKTHEDDCSWSVHTRISGAGYKATGELKKKLDKGDIEKGEIIVSQCGMTVDQLTLEEQRIVERQKIDVSKFSNKISIE